MKESRGWVHEHKRIVVIVPVVSVFVSVFFLVPVVHVTVVACGHDWESLGYYFFKIGYHQFTPPPPSCV